MAADGLRIAMIGSRGVPARYGGVETVVETISVALAAAGHDVTVFCRREPGGPRRSSYEGVDLVHLPTIDRAGLGALIHSFLATLACVGRGYDVIHYHALGPGLFTPFARLLTGAKVVQTIHGRDDLRARWRRPHRLVLRIGLALSHRVPHETMVVSTDLQDQYRNEFGRETTVVPNAVTIPAIAESEIGTRLDLQKGGYAVAVGRLVPEKAVHELIETYSASTIHRPLVVVGGDSGVPDYQERLTELAGDDDRIHLLGAVYGPEVFALVRDAGVFITMSKLEGLPTTLIECVLLGVPVVASDIAPHREILGSDGLGHRLCPVGDPAASMRAVAATFDEPAVARRNMSVVRSRCREHYSLERAVAVHLDVYGADAGPRRAPA